MTTEEELDEILRRALHTAVDSVEPAGDGLQRIHQQLDRPRYQRQLRLWLTESLDAIRLIGIRLEPATERARGAVLAAWAAMLAWLRGRSGADGQAATADGRPRQGAAHRSQPSGRFATLFSPTIAWLRPALAVAAAVVIVVAGVFGLAQLRQTVTDISLLTGGNPTPSHHAPSSHPTTQGSQQAGVIPPLVPSPTPASSKKATTHHHASPAPTCTPRASSSPGGGASPGTTPPTPTSSPSASPSPSDSGAASAGTSGSNPAAIGSMPPAAVVNSPSKPAHKTSKCGG